MSFFSKLFNTDKEARAFAETFVNENKQKMVEDSKQHNMTPIVW